ncbi:hypothetical protein, partial [Pseudomonas turukhanskensis]|uniref:hypothetical protein n=1 Tax=Pseudomonas turukhanskensis TaxID=1806536 RepID=UPI0022F30764
CTEIDLSGQPGKSMACLTAGRYRPAHKKSDSPDVLFRALRASFFFQSSECRTIKKKPKNLAPTWGFHCVKTSLPPPLLHGPG